MPRPRNTAPKGKNAPDREPMNLPATTVVEFTEPDPIIATTELTDADRRFMEAEDKALMTGEVDEEPERAIGGPSIADGISNADLARAQIMMAQAIEKLANSQPVTRVPYAKFKTRSPFNPRGDRKRKLSRRCYQNGFPIDVRKLHDEEIACLNKLKPGRYMDGLVTIAEAQTGGNTDLHIVYANRSYDQRLALPFRTTKKRTGFLEMLQNCLDEGSGERESRDTV